MQQLIEVLTPLVKEIRSAFATAKTGEDPVHTVIQKLRLTPGPTQELKDLVHQHSADFVYIWFFTQTGLSQEGGFFSEMIRRFEESLLPPIPPANDVLGILKQILNEKDRSWLEQITPSQLGRLLSFFSPPLDLLVAPLQKSMEMLAHRISGLGLDPFISQRLRERPELLQNFLNLGNLEFDEEHFGDVAYCLECLKNCERSLLYVRGRTDHEGTSLALTYRIFHIEELIRRFKMLLTLAAQFTTDYKYSALGVLFKQILIRHMEKIQLRQFLGRNIEILAYQVTLLTGNTGEHYITTTKKELRGMWYKAIKGGIVVAFLVVLKVIASKLHLAPLPQAFIYSCIYAGGFVLIHVVGGVLATKQPAMTASTLAAALGSEAHEGEDKNLPELVNVIMRTLRSQLAALFGNYLTAFPVAILIVFPFVIWGHPVATPLKAHNLLMDQHPYLSLSFMYAAIAGVCLFVSGLLSGLADNWFAFNQMAIRLESVFSGPRGKKIINYFKKNFGIWTGNIALGFMLGSMSSVGIVLGLPLDIRHVTFASGALGVAWIDLPYRLPWSDFAFFAASIFVMGLINLTVSFSLSLLVAMKSRRLKFSQGGTLVWLLVKRVLRSPHELFLAKE